MGLALTTAAQWTRDDVETGTLALTPLNEVLLREILQFVEDYSSQHPRLAEHVFEEPLEWTTTLVASDFQAGYEISDLVVQSEEKDREGQPLLRLSPPTVSVCSFFHLSKLLQMSHDKLGEVRACLEENRNAALKILGPRFAAILESEDYKEMEKVKEDQGKDSKAKAELVLSLRNLNKQLLDKLLQHISEQVHLHVSTGRNEVDTLQGFCGTCERSYLKSLRYTSDFVFANGCRAPPHRQLLGEMCYVVVEPCDREALYATYSNQGVFLNKGVQLYEADENDYESSSEIFEDLTTLLKNKSHFFANYIHKKDPDPHNLRRSTNQLKTAKWTEGRVLPVSRKMEEEGSSGEKEIRKSDLGTKSNIKSVSSLPGHYSRQKSRTPSKAKTKETLSESSPESEEEAEQLERRPENNTELPSEHWKIQKLIKYLREGDQTVTVLTMCSLLELDLMQEEYQLAILDIGGLDVLLNILDTKEVRCIIGSLKILRLISHNVQVQRSIVKKRGVQSLVPLLDKRLPELQALAAETLANVAKCRKARRTVRHCAGIEKLVRLLDCVPNSPNLTEKQELDVEAARCGALALWSCSRSTRNKEAIRNAGGIPLLGRLLKSPHVNMLIPVIGTLQECATEESYRNAIRSEGMIKDLVKNLSSDNDELQMHAASAIFKCAEDEKTREMIYQYKGPQRLALLLSKADNKQLLAAATGAIWKCSLSQKNVTKFQEYRVLEKLVTLMTDQPEDVLVNVVGALGEFAQKPANKRIIGQCGGIQQLVKLLTGRNEALLVIVTKTLGVCATDKDNMTMIDQLDGLRLVWSLLKNPSPDVQASAAWALCPIIENGKDAKESVRCLIGGLQLLIKLLKSTNNEVLASICAVIAKITEDKEENVALLTDYGVVPLLANLTSTTDERLRRHLAEAIANCCMWGQNRAAFGQARAVAPLVRYVKSNNSSVHETTVVALYQLSKHVDNCITLHSNGVVKPLLELMGHDNEDVAYMAAGCVRNIRMLANANKMARWYT